MRILVRIFAWLYTQSLKFYPSSFRAEFGDEMQLVFSNAMERTQKGDVLKLLAFFGREIRDWPGAVWREHLRSRKGVDMSQNNLAWRPLNTKELLAGLVLFVLPIIPSTSRLFFGYNKVTLAFASALIFTILIAGIVILALGIKNGFPRWTIPYLGVTVISLVMLQAVYPLWGLFADDVRQMIKYYTKTLAARIQYSVLLDSFFWLVDRKSVV